MRANTNQPRNRSAFTTSAGAGADGRWIEKAAAVALRLHTRQALPVGAALVLGAGPIGLLTSLVLLDEGVPTWVTDVAAPDAPRARLAAALGARYVALPPGTPAADALPAAAFDCIVEATDSAANGLAALPLLATGGSVVLLSHAAQGQAPARARNRVDLPVPLSPWISTRSPGRITASARRTRTRPSP
jgi:threonine dehydrogenase-like Zn-dependent dehydrogenase